MAASSPGTGRRLPPVLGGGRFVVCGPLGDGGTAGVYLCWDWERMGWVALKAMRTAHLKDPEIRARFKAEAETMQRLSHPHIPELYAYDIDASPPYLVMELARCGSAMSWVKSHGPMPPGLAVDVLVQMCEALAHAHAHGVVHRDVKPHNFLIDDEGSFKLTDFGIARVDEHTSMTATGSQIGTFSFMAPEQRSDTKSVDEGADIYALGASLYTMLTGRTSAELFIAQDEDALLEAVPEPFRPVVIRACAYRRDERYDTIRQLQSDLLSALSRLPSAELEHLPIQTPPPLPSGPPDVLPEGLVFDDLLSALALDLDNPTWVPSPAARAAMERTASGTPTPVPIYTMSRPAPVRTDGELPSYLDQHERHREAKREADLAAARQVEAARAAPPPVVESDESAPWLEWVAYGLGGMLLVIVVFLVGSAGWVQLAASQTHGAAKAFSEALVSESSVVYDLGGDQRFEDLYAAWDASRGAERIAAAISFADELERALNRRQGSVEPEVLTRAQRILSARETYADAYATWQHRAGTFPGSVPVSLGVVPSP